MTDREYVAAVFQDRARTLHEDLNALVARLGVFEEFARHFPEVDEEAQRLCQFFSDTEDAARRLRNVTKGLPSRVAAESQETPSPNTATERMILTNVTEERLVMWRGHLSWRAKRLVGRRAEDSYLALTPNQITSYNVLVDRGVILPPDGHGDFARIAL